MFKIFINDGIKELPEDDIFYIISKEGVFLKKKLGIIESITPVKNISFLNNLSLLTSAKLHIPKIPTIRFAKIVSFFKEIFNLYKGEAIALIYYNENTKRFKFHIPIQVVSPGSIKYLTDKIDGYNLIGDIHSHGSMSAFHSGVDDHDEKDFDGLHITVGNVNKSNLISISSSIVSNGMRFMVDPENYIHGISFENNFASAGVNFYIIEASDSQKRFNEKWLSQVSEKKIKHNIIFDFGKLEDHKKHFPISMLLKDEDFNPCAECIFKNYKIEALLEEITEEVDEDDIDVENLVNNFQVNSIEMENLKL